MKLDKDQFLEAGFIFEKANGHSHSDFEKDIIAKSKLTKYESCELERLIVDGLNSHLYKNDACFVSISSFAKASSEPYSVLTSSE